MAGFWSVVLPAAATNLVTNPSFETNTTGWATSGGGSIARVATRQRRGAWSLEHTPAAGLTSGVAWSTITVVSGQAYTVSFDFRGAVGVPYKATVSVGGSGTVQFTGDGAWHRYSLTWTTSGTSAVVTIGKDNSASTAAWNLDGVQLELGSSATTYIDGDQAGCAWSSTAHGSTSSRSGQSRAGGTVVNLDDYSMAVQQLGGVGAPPIDVVGILNGFADGGTYQRSRAKERPLTLQLTAQGSSQANLHSIRKSLFDALKPDRVSPPQPIQLRYAGTGNETMLIDAVYDAGLEYGSQRGFLQTIPQRLIAYDPYWRIDGSGGASLTVSASLANTNYIAQRPTTGIWAALSTGTNGAILALATAPDGTLYASGQFTTAGGGAANRIAKWNGSAWSALGTGMNGDTYALVVGPDGTLYAGGNFTTAGGVACNYIAKWNGSAWSAMSTGMNVLVQALAIGPDGTLYAGGGFTTAGGGAANYIAKWNGSAWSAMSTGMDVAVSALAVGLDGTVYAGGNFTTAGGASASKIAKWNGSAWSSLGTGMGASVLALAVGLDGTVYAGGTFTTAGGASANRIAQWNGAAWSSLGTGLNNPASALAVGSDGTLYVGGTFSTAGGIAVPDALATWNGSAWSASDANLPGTAGITAIAVLPTSGTVVVGYDQTGSSTVAGATTVTNAGTATTYPIITITATSAAVLYEILNTTAGQEIYFSNLTVQAGEQIVIDLTPGRKTIISSFRGNLLSSITPGSNLATWALQPGDNTVIAFAGSGISVSMYWPIRHWSIDGGAA